MTRNVTSRNMERSHSDPNVLRTLLFCLLAVDLVFLVTVGRPTLQAVLGPHYQLAQIGADLRVQLRTSLVVWIALWLALAVEVKLRNGAADEGPTRLYVWAAVNVVGAVLLLVPLSAVQES